MLCLLCVAGAGGAFAQTARLEQGRSRDGATTVRLRLDWDGTMDTVGGFVTPHIGGMNSSRGEVGAPGLPTLSQLITVPRGTKVEITDVATSFTTIHTPLPIAPIVPARAKDDEPVEPIPDNDIYSTDSFYRTCPPAILEHLGTMGNEEVYRLTVAPFEYNPVREEVRFSISSEFGVRSSELMLPHPENSELRTLNSELSTTYLIVAPEMFGEGLREFADWKRQEGFDVREILLTTTDRDSIKALIEAAGSESGYILLVGDAEQIPPFAGTSRPEGFTTHTTDLYYAERTGDYLPDALLGRWPVNDTAELRRVVEKTLRYEQCRSLDSTARRRAMLVAGMESQQPAPVTTNGQVNYVKGRLTELLPGVDTLCWYNPESDTQRAAILQQIAVGAAMVNYTAHCTASGWSHPSVDYAAIDTLDESQPTFYINNCCKSNTFDGDGFGERLLRKATGGAVGVIGATNSTLWNEDYYWSVGPKYPFSLEPEYDSLRPGAIDRWLENGLTAGGILAAGNLAVSAFGSPYDKFYWEIYCLLGDPSLKPLMGMPQALCLDGADTVRVGATQVAVRATPGAKVTAVQGHRLLGIAVAGTDSLATLQLAIPVDTIPLLLTATAPQAIPAVDTILPLPPQGAALAFRNVTVGDTSVDFTLVNVGTDTAYSLTVSLLPDTAEALFLATLHTVDTLLPGSEIPLHTTLYVTTWAPDWSGVLTAQDATGEAMLCSLRMGHTLGLPPTLSFLLLNADSTVATEVQPGNGYLLQVDVDGEYDTLAASIDSSQSTHLHLHGYVGRGRYGRDYDYWLVAGGREEGFEEGFDSHPWNLGTMRPWIIDSTERHGGSYSLRSAPIAYRQTSDLIIDVLLMADDSISFWLKTSSEEGYDKLVFSVDGEYRGSWSGLFGWYRRAYPLSSGRHTLRWRYYKDDSGSSWDDCAWIDDLRMPLALWDSAYGWIDTTTIDPEPPVSVGSPDIQDAYLYPNPVERWLTVGIAGEVMLTDLYGRTVLTTRSDGQTAIDLGALPRGIYFATINSNGETYRQKIIKK